MNQGKSSSLNACQRSSTTDQSDLGSSCYRQIIAAIPDPVCFLDVDSGFLGCNPSFEHLIGVGEAEMLRKKPGDIFAPQMAAIFNQQREVAIESGNPQKFSHWFENFGGRRFFLEIQQSPCYSDQGNLAGVICISRDITGQQHLQEALEEQRQRLQLLIFAANIGVWEWLVSTGEMTCNEYSAALLGYNLEELAPLNFETWTGLCQPDDAVQFRRLLEEYLAGDVDFFECECRMRHKDGHWVWVQSRGSAVEWNSKYEPWRLFGTHTDVTARKEAEEQLRLNNENLEQRVRERTQALQETLNKMVLQEKMASLGQLAAGIAHEINNPIHFIRTNNASLSQDFADLREILQDYRRLTSGLEVDGFHSADLAALRAKENALQLDYILDDIPTLFAESEKGFERIARIIQSMRTFSHVPFQKHHSYANINQGIEDALILAHNSYKYHAEITLEFGELPEIYCAPEQLNQVFLNLIVNSSQAIAAQNRSEKGHIAIRSWYADGAIHCEFADDGPGIPAAIRSRIFEPFFTTKEPGEGTGLGLSISYDIIVSKHHGDLTVHCPETGGTVFTIDIPANVTTSETTANKLP